MTNYLLHYFFLINILFLLYFPLFSMMAKGLAEEWYPDHKIISLPSTKHPAQKSQNLHIRNHTTHPQFIDLGFSTQTLDLILDGMKQLPVS